MEKRNLAARAGHWSATHRKTAIFGWLGFVVVAFLIGNAVTQKEMHGADDFSGESGRAETALFDSGLRPNDENVMVQSDSLTIQDPRFRSAVTQASNELSKAQYVVNVKSPIGGGAPVSDDGHAALVQFQITGDDLQAADRLASSKAVVASVQDDHPDLRVEQFGSASTNKELNTIFQNDLFKAEGLSFPLTLLILIVAFGALVAALIPLLLCITAVMAAEQLVTLPSQLSPIDSNVSSVILLIGLAVCVDYSLFYLRREREARAAGKEMGDALDVAAGTSGKAVLISGVTVIAAMAGMFLSGDKTFISFAEGTILVVAIAIVASLTVLPAVLSWLGDRVENGRIPFMRKRRPAGDSRFWSRVVSGAMRRPWLSIALAGGALVALAIPAFGMKIVTSGPDDLPQDLALIKTYNSVKAAFPEEAVIADVAVESDNVRSGPAAAGIARLQRQAANSDQVRPGTEVTYSDDGTVALVSIPTVGSGNDGESEAALDQVRDVMVPATVGAVPGVTVNVSGSAASSVDFRNQLKNRLPLIFGFVFALTFIIMLFTFRSIVIPIKAILLNLLSVGAAYGVLVLVFQNGWGESLLGFTSNGGVTNWLPLFLFVIVFGLSMDYHVFIVSRIREAVDRGMSTDDAVRHGIKSTAGVVTSAAVVMVAVFSIFGSLSAMEFKQMGVGLAVAILLDATLVRGVLLPSAMTLLGERNWYLPSWLGWLPRFEHEPVVLDERHEDEEERELVPA